MVEEKESQNVETEEEEDARFPFPKARVVKIIKEEIGGSKQIRSEVKDEINIWLGKLLRKLAREMGTTQYGSVGIADFHRAVRPYDIMEDLLKDEERLLTSIQKLKLDAEYIIREMERFFSSVKGRDIEE